MVKTCNGRGDPEPAHPNGNPPPPPTLAQAITSILESRDEQTKLLWQLVANSAQGVHGTRNAPAPALTTYSNFAATHLPLFTEAGDSLYHVAAAWWANYTASRPTDYQVSWTKF
jgi:hypothetical protein